MSLRPWSHSHKNVYVFADVAMTAKTKWSDGNGRVASQLILTVA